jgi:hypothetical protein
LLPSSTRCPTDGPSGFGQTTLTTHFSLNKGWLDTECLHVYRKCSDEPKYCNPEHVIQEAVHRFRHPTAMFSRDIVPVDEYVKNSVVVFYDNPYCGGAAHGTIWQYAGKKPLMYFRSLKRFHRFLSKWRKIKNSCAWLGKITWTWSTCMMCSSQGICQLKIVSPCAVNIGMNTTNFLTNDMTRKMKTGKQRNKTRVTIARSGAALTSL